MKSSLARLILTIACLAAVSSQAFAESKWTHWFTSKHDHVTGARQKYHSGRYWPPQPRPCGDQEPFVQQYHTAHYWPHPYQCQDRSYIHDILDRQKVNGWKAYTTLYDYHFNYDTQELNQAGQLHLQWIALYAPTKHRVAYIAEGINSRDSQIRLANVQSVLSAIVGPGGLAPPTQLRRAQSIGTPAEEVDRQRRIYLDTMIEPHIRYEWSATGTGN